MHVHPAALVPDVGHFEEIAVQSGILQGSLKSRFMGSGRTRGDHHPVEVMLNYFLFDFLLGILGAGIQIVLSINHMIQSAGIIPHDGDIYNSPDIYPTVADKYPDPGFLLTYIPFFRVFLNSGQSPSGGCKQGRDTSCCPTGLHHRLRDIFRARKSSAGKNPWFGGLQRGKRAGGTEVIPVQVDP